MEEERGKEGDAGKTEDGNVEYEWGEEVGRSVGGGERRKGRRMPNGMEIQEMRGAQLVRSGGLKGAGEGDRTEGRKEGWTEGGGKQLE